MEAPNAMKTGWSHYRSITHKGHPVTIQIRDAALQLVRPSYSRWGNLPDPP